MLKIIIKVNYKILTSYMILFYTFSDVVEKVTRKKPATLEGFAKNVAGGLVNVSK
jgi:hypothetical protein